MAEVFITAAARRQIEDLPLAIHARVTKVLERLTRWPAVSGAKPLRGTLAGQYRVRTGDYRVQFQVQGSGAAAVITVVRVGKRDRFYD
jgi:mRNA-degrading endonuclease RelE of RelBE toxin-antitoxin system